MQDSNSLLEKAKQKAALSPATQTEAGQMDSKQKPFDKDAVIEAIERIFAEFELVYHNQFTKAFPTLEKLQYAKRLWFSHLMQLPPTQIVAAAQRAIKESEYLPTIRGLLKYCDSELDLYGLPDTRAAYVEACMATAPQDQAQWSHPAVYYAGKASDWFFLANNAEKIAFPVFERNYQIMCQRVRQGEQLQLPVVQALPERVDAEPLSAEQQQAHLANLRNTLHL